MNPLQAYLMGAQAARDNDRQNSLTGMTGPWLTNPWLTNYTSFTGYVDWAFLMSGIGATGPPLRQRPDPKLRFRGSKYDDHCGVDGRKWGGLR